MDWSSYLTQAADAVWAAIKPIVTVGAKGLFAAVFTGGLAQLTVEWVYGPVAQGTEKVVAAGRLTNEPAKRLAALGIGMGAVLAAHACSWPYDFGPGPQGWGAAALSGFLAGGLAPVIHDRFRKRKAAGKWAPVKAQKAGDA